MAAMAAAPSPRRSPQTHAAALRPPPRRPAPKGSPARTFIFSVKVLAQRLGSRRSEEVLAAANGAVRGNPEYNLDTIWVQSGYNLRCPNELLATRENIPALPASDWFLAQPSAAQYLLRLERASDWSLSSAAQYLLGAGRMALDVVDRPKGHVRAQVRGAHHRLLREPGGQEGVRRVSG
eukprot:132092-Prorocentrum_minimum.AAC.1